MRFSRSPESGRRPPELECRFPATSWVLGAGFSVSPGLCVPTCNMGSQVATPAVLTGSSVVTSIATVRLYHLQGTFHQEA